MSLSFFVARAGSASGWCFALALVFNPLAQRLDTGYWLYSPQSFDAPRQFLLRQLSSMVRNEYAKDCGQEFTNPVSFAYSFECFFECFF